MKSLLYLLAFIVMVSCSPQALVPFEYNPQVDADPVSIIEANDLNVYMENIERKSDLLVFDLEIVNNSESAVQLNHPELYYYAGKDKFNTVSDTVTMDIESSYALPTQKINHRNALSQHRVERYYENRAAGKKAAGILLFAVGVGLVVNDIVQDGKDIQKPFWTENDQNRAVTRDVLTASSLLAIDIVGNEMAREEAKSHEDLHYVPFEMFPEQRIAPGKSLRGKIYFPVNQPFKFYRFIVPIGNTDYIFDFRKRKQADKDRLRGHHVRH